MKPLNLGLSFLLISARPFASQGFPVPRADEEIRATIPQLHEIASRVKGDEAKFKKYVLPYAPLNLQTGPGLTYDE